MIFIALSIFGIYYGSKYRRTNHHYY